MPKDAANERIAELLVQPFAVEMLRDRRLHLLFGALSDREVTPHCRDLLAPLEPLDDPDLRSWPWTRSLYYRAECYRVTGDPRWREARATYEKALAEEEARIRGIMKK
jgi:hypothetical protein